jgi:hypothetical protein
MMPIEPFKMQSLSDVLGEHAASRFCAPLAFYMVLRAAGYLPQNLMPDTFCLDLGNGELKTTNADWSRPALSKMLRQKYQAAIVSWQLKGGANLELMKRAGYIETSKEVEFFTKQVHGRTLKQIVQAGYPVIVTMQPGFGSDENSNIHAVILAAWEDDEVIVFDPDARNNNATFKADYVQEYLSPSGAGSIVLPKATTR